VSFIGTYILKTYLLDPAATFKNSWFWSVCNYLK